MPHLDPRSALGDFGETFVELAAAAAGFLHGRPHSLDREMADVEVTFPGVLEGVFNPTVKIQVKSTATRLVQHGDPDTLRYDLDVRAYDLLRRRDCAVPRVLSVVESLSGERLSCSAGGYLVGVRALWVSLEGGPDSDRRSRVPVSLPVANALDVAGMRRMMSLHGIRRTTRSPGTDPWGAR